MCGGGGYGECDRRPSILPCNNLNIKASWMVFHYRSFPGQHVALAHTVVILCIYVLASLKPQSSRSPLEISFFLFSTYAIIALSITILYRLSPWHPLARYPGPLLAKTTSLWLSYISFTGKRYLILDRLHAQYGPYLRIGPFHLSINSPTGVSIYSSMEKSDSYHFPGRNGAISLFFKQDALDIHRDRRKIWQPMFTPAGLSQVIPQLERRTMELVQSLARRQSASKTGFVDLPEIMFYWAHDFTGDMVFGGCNTFELMKNGDPRHVIYTGKIATAMLDSVGQSPWLMDIVWQLPLAQRMHRLANTSAHLMRARMKTSMIPTLRDLASYLLDSDMTQHELETDAIVAMVGGSDNTSITVAFAIYFLLVNRTYYEQLRQELGHAFPEPMGPLPMNELAALPFLNAVINETLRLASPYFLPRVAPPGGTHLDGNYIPEGTVVALAAYSQQISSDNFFPAPLDFHPERWEPNGLGPLTRTNKSILASFSFGPHSCIGKALAYQQMRLALSRLILALDMELPPGFDATGFRAGILNMRTMFLEKKLYVKCSPRPGVNLQATGDC
ncbi:cytochrome P450 [Daedaleopsis nitida]|nr:cytochrome P450 [Daedaleopsis nitida]